MFRLQRRVALDSRNGRSNESSTSTASGLSKLRTLLAIRSRLSSDDTLAEIIKGRTSINTLPGTARKELGTWQGTTFLTADLDGNIVEYQRWGDIKIPVHPPTLSMPFCS